MYKKTTMYIRKYIKTSHSFLDFNEDYLTETEEIRNPFFIKQHGNEVLTTTNCA